MCNYPFPIIECKPHIEYVNDLIAIARERFGFELLGYSMLLMSDNNCSIESYGAGIRWQQSQNIDFEIVMCLRINGMAYLFSKNGFEVKVDYKNSQAIIMRQMEERQKKIEMDNWRTKLRSCGIETEW